MLEQQIALSSPLEDAILQFGVIPGALEETARHHLTRPGKRTRAGLLRSFCAGRVEPRTMLAAAAACELIHEASIVHDDLQDRTRLRRGQPAVWAHFGEDAALLLGDHLIAAAFRALAGSVHAPRFHDMVAHLADAVSAAASGQLGQLGLLAGNGSLRSSYERHAGDKTGRLLALPLVLAALLRDEAPEAVTSLAVGGRDLGLAYQILNDVQPLLGDRSGHEDLRNQTVTAPVVVAHELAPEADPFRVIANGTLDEVLMERCWGWLTAAAEQGLSAAAGAPEDMVADLRGFVELSLRAPAAAFGPVLHFAPRRAGVSTAEALCYA